MEANQKLGKQQKIFGMQENDVNMFVFIRRQVESKKKQMLHIIIVIDLHHRMEGKVDGSKSYFGQSKDSNCFKKAVNILDLACLLYFVSFYK